MALNFKLDQSSLRRVLKNIERQGDVFSKKAASALRIEAEEILTRSRSEVPVDQGILRNDSGVEGPQKNGDRIEVGVWYGDGPAKDYAVPQHERMDFSHVNGGPKYLERRQIRTLLPICLP